jgi:hypothetical protein
MKFEGLNDNWIFLKPLGWPELKKRINKQLERAYKLIAKAKSEELKSIAKVESEELTSIKNSRNLPSNATIRKEYVRCGKLDCASKHGPYYYAYWKDDEGKLRKEYIGKYPPPVENKNKDKSGDMDLASRDALTDPTNSLEEV